jgi:hypothetical protein
MLYKSLLIRGEGGERNERVSDCIEYFFAVVCTLRGRTGLNE